MDNQQGPTVWHRELCSMLSGSLDRRGAWGRTDTCICMAESLCYPPETITTLLTSYTPILNKKLKKEWKQDPNSKYNQILRFWELGLSTCKCWEDIIQPITALRRRWTNQNVPGGHRKCKKQKEDAKFWLVPFKGLKDFTNLKTYNHEH